MCGASGNKVFGAAENSHARNTLSSTVVRVVTSVLRPQFDGGVGSEALQVLRGQGDEVVGVLLQVADGVVLKEQANVSIAEL